MQKWTVRDYKLRPGWTHRGMFGIGYRTTVLCRLENQVSERIENLKACDAKVTASLP